MSSGAMKLSIQDKRNPYSFRQTRFTNELGALTVEVRNQICMVFNWSRTGVGFEAPSPFLQMEEGQTIEGVRVLCQGQILYEGSALIKYKASDSAYSTCRYGIMLTNGVLPVEAVESLLTMSGCMEKLRSLAKDMESANHAFCHCVVTLRLALEEIKRVCEQEEKRYERMTFDMRHTALEAFLPTMALGLKEIFFNFNREIAQHVDLDNLPEDSAYHRIFREMIYPLFENADIIKRAYEKPRGYAGDYEMMNQIYRNGFEGRDLFGKVLHHYITNENSAESVKYRREFFHRFFETLAKTPGQKSSLTVACGPAVEVQELIRNWSQERLSNFHFTLLDLDKEALEHAQAKIFELAFKSKKVVQVDFINASIKSFLTGNVTASGSFDLIYSGGLFDYLDNLTATALTAKLYSLLAPGGKLVIGNFTKENKTKAFLHLLTHWTLIHKSDQEILDWAKNLPQSKTSVELDPLKMHAYLVVEKL